jgi:hypothetical protein
LLIEDLKAPGAERVTLLKASPEAKSVPVEFREASGDAQLLRGAKRSASAAPLAAALRRPVESGKESRLVVFGGWEAAAPAVISRGTEYGNRDLILNALNWLAERNVAIGIVEREIAPSRVDLTQGFVTTFRWISMGALPAILAAIGIAAWLKRRN